MFLINIGFKGVPLWCTKFRIWYCHCSSLGDCCRRFNLWLRNFTCHKCDLPNPPKGSKTVKFGNCYISKHRLLALSHTNIRPTIPSRLFFFFFFWSFWSFLGPHPWHIEVSRLGVQSELQPPAYARATATLGSEPHLQPTPQLTAKPDP